MERWICSVTIRGSPASEKYRSRPGIESMSVAMRTRQIALVSPCERMRMTERRMLNILK